MDVSRRLVAVAAMGCVLTLSLVACGSGNRSEPDLGEVLVVTDSSELTLPLDAYEWSTDGQRISLRARGQVVRACLSRFGLEVPAEPVPDDLPDSEPWNQRRYGLFDLTAARSRGYNAAAGPDQGLRYFSLEEGQQSSSLEEALEAVEEFRRQQGHRFPGETERFLRSG